VVSDSPTVDLTLSGTGAVGDPYDVQADVIVDPAPPGGGANLLHEGADGLYVECADVRTCFTGGDAIEIDPATGEISVEVSAQAGNQVITNPDGLYVAPSAGGVTALEVTDTPTVDLTLTGAGTAGDPYDVTAAVRLDATPPGGGTNLIESGADGLYVECADVRGCLSEGPGIDYDPATGVIAADISADAGNTIALGADGGLYSAGGGGGTPTVVQAGDTPTANNTVTGTGSAGTPYVITTDVILDPTPPGGGANLLEAGPDGLYVECADVRGCLSAGDGIDYDPATGVIAADISGDAGNTLVVGTDGGLMVPPSAGGGATALEVTDTPSVNLTLTGTGAAGDPYDVSAAVLLSADANNRAAFGSDGALYVPPADPLSVGACGLTGDGSAASPLAAAVGTWPYPCSIDALGGVVACDSTGQLRSEPRGQVSFFSFTEARDYANEPVPAGFDQPGDSFATSVTNPDPCRPALLLIEREADVDFILPAGAGAAYGHSTDEVYYTRNTGTTTINDAHTQTSKVFALGALLAPGATTPLTFDVTVGRGSGGATWNRIQVFIRALLISL
jgi:hypothetical protein